MSQTTKKKSAMPNYGNPERLIVLTGEISEETVEQVMHQLTTLASESSPDPIVVRITSHGGCGASGFAIFDAIRTCNVPVVTEAWGCAESAAALIFQAGAFRRIAPSTRLLMHNGRGSSPHPLNAQELEREATDMLVMDKMYVDAIANRIDAPAELVKQWCAEERYFNAAEARAVGLADEIIGG